MGNFLKASSTSIIVMLKHESTQVRHVYNFNQSVDSIIEVTGAFYLFILYNEGNIAWWYDIDLLNNNHVWPFFPTNIPKYHYCFTSGIIKQT